MAKERTASKIVLMRDSWKKLRKMSQAKVNDTYAVSAFNSIDVAARRRKKGAKQEEVNFLAWAGVAEDLWGDMLRLLYVYNYLGRVVRGAGGKLLCTSGTEWGFDPKEKREVQLIVIRFFVELKGIDGAKIRREYDDAVLRKKKW